MYLNAGCTQTFSSVLTPALALHQVCAMRLPVEVLQAHLGAMLEGLLLWSEDSKNKFRLKVRGAPLKCVGGANGASDYP